MYTLFDGMTCKLNPTWTKSTTRLPSTIIGVIESHLIGAPVELLRAP